ncbi:helix-turn-helix domain-containing protein [Enterococcus sp. AZ072]|uniref:helix-turn-helix domain-containing protein n=1 Tax=unclassified Enterococcus TaxID=2608891 RepID=UPI003D2B78A9
MGVGKVLKGRRELMGVSQEKIAQKMYVSRQTISNWELGKTYPDIEKLIALSEFYEVTLDELVKEDSIMKEKLITDAKELAQLRKHKTWFRISQSLSSVAFGGALFSDDYTWLLIIAALLFSVFGAYHWTFFDDDKSTDPLFP